MAQHIIIEGSKLGVSLSSDGIEIVSGNIGSQEFAKLSETILTRLSDLMEDFGSDVKIRIKKEQSEIAQAGAMDFVRSLFGIDKQERSKALEEIEELSKDIPGLKKWIDKNQTKAEDFHKKFKNGKIDERTLDELSKVIHDKKILERVVDSFEELEMESIELTSNEEKKLKTSLSVLLVVALSSSLAEKLQLSKSLKPLYRKQLPKSAQEIGRTVLSKNLKVEHLTKDALPGLDVTFDHAVEQLLKIFPEDAELIKSAQKPSRDAFEDLIEKSLADVKYFTRV